MENIKKVIIVNKTYGIHCGTLKGKERWFVVSNGKQIMNLNYAKKDFALKKAYSFVKALWKPFTKFDGTVVNFTFTQED